MRADWLLPDDKKLEVTLKILNTEKNLIVSSICADIFSPESFIVKNTFFFYFNRNFNGWQKTGAV